MRFSLFYSALLLATPIAGWGDVGHRTVAYLAQKYFTEDASNWVNEMLVNDKGYDISDAATFADTVKRARPHTRPWHYIDALDHPFDNECNVDLNRDCGKEGCIVKAIINMTSLVLDTEQTPKDRSESLMFLMHFIGDLHQPLHVENESTGGNDIKGCFDKRCSGTNLHSVWDTDIIHKLRGLKHSEKHNEERTAAASWADDLASSLGDKDDVMRKMREECADITDPEHCIMSWAEETNKLNCDYVLTKGKKWLQTANLGGEYYKGAVPIVTKQVEMAGLRLAGWINAMHESVSVASPKIIVQDGGSEL